MNGAQQKVFEHQSFHGIKCLRAAKASEQQMIQSNKSLNAAMASERRRPQFSMLVFLCFLHSLPLPSARCFHFLTCCSVCHMVCLYCVSD